MVGGSTISKLIAIVVGTYLLGAYAMAADGLHGPARVAFG